MRNATMSALAAALCLAACQPGAPPPPANPAPAPAKAPVASATPAPAASVAPPAASSAFAGEALSRLLMCGDPDFLLRPGDEQAQALQGEPRLRCDAPSAAGGLRCTAAEPVTAFGLRLHAFTLSHAQGGHALVASLQGEWPALLQGIATAYPKPVRSALGGQLLSLRDDDGFALRAREGGEAGQASVECRWAAPRELLFVTLNEPVVSGAPMVSSSLVLPAAAATSAMAVAATTANVPKLAPGNSSIAGRIEYPGESLPALQVCAYRSDNGGAACVRTAREQNRYRIERLPAGDYLLWAWLLAPEGEMRVMRALHAVQCFRAPCLPQPRTVRLPEDTAVDGITLNDAAESYPDQPVAPFRSP